MLISQPVIKPIMIKTIVGAKIDKWINRTEGDNPNIDSGIYRQPTF